VQYFLNGYRNGDPRIRPAADGRTDDQPDLPDEVDVLIVGTGPSGLLLAAQLSEFPDILTRVVERAPGPLQVGRADGVNCKTVETFEAFGLAERMMAEAYWVNQTTFWGPDPEDSSRIKRFGRVQDVRDGLSDFRTSSSTRPGWGTSSWSTHATPRAASRSTTATTSSRCGPPSRTMTR
jgi:phenol 2-monooxygenase (NADPH)